MLWPKSPRPDGQTTGRLLQEALELARPHLAEGRPADYIPELAGADPTRLGAALMADGRLYRAGDADLPFTMQSIAKAFALILALERIGADALFQRVGAHPSEAPFNSLPAVIDGRCVPANPMLNAGCFVTLDSIPGEEVFPRFEARVRTLCGSGAIAPDEAVCRSEWATCTRNREILAVLQQAGALRRSPGEILELHIRTSALQVTACDLAFFGAVLGSGGLDPRSGRRLVDAGVVRIVCTILFQCGMYNASGPFALSVGMPAKSGVGGGIAAAGPGLGIGVYGPALDGCGNSVGGQKVLEHLSQALKLHWFDL